MNAGCESDFDLAYPDPRVHASGVDQGQSEGASGRSGRLRFLISYCMRRKKEALPLIVLVNTQLVPILFIPEVMLLQLPEDRLLMYCKVKLVAFVGGVKIIFFPYGLMVSYGAGNERLNTVPWPLLPPS
jgi:hypothetical protein